MRAQISNTNRIVKHLETELNKPIRCIYDGVDEDKIVFEDDTFVYCDIKFILDDEIRVEVTLLNDEFDVVRKIEFDY
jgi:hypothetical protein